jgi:heme exporter protein CcmD
MTNYALYVWSSVGIAALVLLWNWATATLAHRRALRDALAMMQAEEEEQHESY